MVDARLIRACEGARRPAARLVGLALLGAAALPLAAQTPGEPDVRELRLESAVFGNTRTLRVFLPPGYDSDGPARSYPALYLNDGFAVFSERAWDGPRQLKRLIEAGSLPPLILVGIDNAASIPGSKAPALDRASEYLPWADASEPELKLPRGQHYPRFLYDEVMPLVERSFRVDRGSIGLGGASYGALAALHAAALAPRRVSHLLLESPPLFLFGGRMAGGPTDGRWPGAVYVGIGSRETEDPEIAAKGMRAIERFVAAARGAGVRVTLNRVEGATHGSAAWKARLPAALTALYGSREPQPD